MSRAVRSISALRPLTLSSIAGLIALSLLGFFSLTFSTSNASHSGGMDAMSIDMDVTGNSATELGPRDECIEVSAGDDVVIDVTATNIPESNPAIAFSFDLIYNATNLSVIANDSQYLLASLPGSTLIDASEPLPDSDGTFNSAVLDFGVGDIYESGSGVLSRITIDTSGAAPAVYSFFLTETAHVDPSATGYPPDTINNAFIAVDDTCDNLPTPTPTPTPTSTPPPETPTPTPPPQTPTPTPVPPETSVGIDHNGGTADINPGPKNVLQGISDSVQVVGSSPDIGLEAWEIDIVYDSTVISVDSCDAGAIGLNLCSVDAVANDTIRVVGANASGIQGDKLIFATINFTAVGTDSECTDLTLTVNQYADVNSQQHDPGITNGQICIGSVGPPTPIPSPSPSPTPSPGPEPVGGCPKGGDWNLAQISAAIPELDNDNFSDNNGDGFGCYRVNKGQTKKHGASSWTWKDNANPLP